MPAGGPLVSIVMGAYQAGPFLEMTLGSILGQSFRDFELILVDDGSTDETSSIARRFQDERLRIVRHERNRGPGAARNTALDLARGRYAALADSDDSWAANRLEVLVSLILSEPGTFVADDQLICLSAPDGGLVGWRTLFRQCELRVSGSYREVPPELFVERSIGPIKPLFPLDVARARQVRHREDIWNAEDFDFRMRLYRAGLRLLALRQPLYYYRVRRDALSSRPGRMEVEARVCADLMREGGFDERTTAALGRKKRGLESYAGFVGAIRGGRVAAAFSHCLSHPGVLVEAASALPQWCSRRWLALRLGSDFR